MVEVAYDDCKYLCDSLVLLLTIDLCAAGSLQVDNAGEIVVYNPGDIAWVLASTALVWIMVPGVGFFYSGLLRRVYRTSPL